MKNQSAKKTNKQKLPSGWTEKQVRELAEYYDHQTEEEQVAEHTSVKRQVRELLDKLPQDATFEDVQYHIYVRQKIERGLSDLAAGRVMSQAEAERRMARWLRP